MHTISISIDWDLAKVRRIGYLRQVDGALVVVVGCVVVVDVVVGVVVDVVVGVVVDVVVGVVVDVVVGVVVDVVVGVVVDVVAGVVSLLSTAWTLHRNPLAVRLLFVRRAISTSFPSKSQLTAL